jgi:hypothetical protein
MGKRRFAHLDLIDVDVEEDDARELLGEFDKVGADHAAWAAPSRREVDDDLGRRVATRGSCEQGGCC